MMNFGNIESEYHVVRHGDGYYVVGRGMVCPVPDSGAGEQMIRRLLAAIPEHMPRNGAARRESRPEPHAPLIRMR